MGTISTLYDAAQRGLPIVCGNGGRLGKIRALDIRNLILGGSSISPFGIQIYSARVTEKLDLSNTVIPFPLHFIDCQFTDELAIEGANVQELHIVRSTLPGLIGNGLQVRRDLSLSGSFISGAYRTSSSLRRSSAIWLTESTIEGRLLAVGTQIETKADRAIQADRSRINGDVRLVHGFTAKAEIRLLAAQLDGSLDLTGSRLNPFNGRALDIAGAVIGGSVFFIDDPEENLRPVVNGRVEMNGTVINDRLWFRHAKLTAPKQGAGLQHYNTKDPGERLALIAPGLKVRGRLIIEESTIEGGLAFPGATIDGRVLIDGHIINPENLALDLSYSELGASLDVVNKSTFKGTVQLGGIRVDGDIDFADAYLSAPQRGYAGVRDCVYGAGARIAGDVRFARSTVTNGAINFRGAEIAGDMDANDATFINHGDRTVNLHYTHVLGNVQLCRGFRSEGLVALNRSMIEGRLQCDEGTFLWKTGPYAQNRKDFNTLDSAFEAISATVRAGIGLGWTIGDDSTINFTDTRTSFLADSAGPSDWPSGRCHISGLTYERFAPLKMDQGEGVWDVTARTQWLIDALPPTRIDEPADPGPWEQAAQTLARRGDARGAEQLLINFARHERRSRRYGRLWPRLRHLARRSAAIIHDGLSGYGFRPFNALWYLAAMVAVLAIALAAPAVQSNMRTTDPQGVVWTTAGRLPGQCDVSRNGSALCPVTDMPGHECGDGSVRCFNAFFYAIDTAIPIVDLKQRATWYPTDDASGRTLTFILGFCTIAGWALSSVFVVGLARAGSRTLSARGGST